MITLKEVKNKKDLKAFVKFPFTLYKDCEYWTPPIISQEMSTFNKNENPVFQDAEAQLFLAYKNNAIVGRIAAITNNLEIQDQNIKKMRFGWFDFIDDLEVSKILLDKVAEIGKSKNLEYTEGPVGFSNLDKVGVMTEGFESTAPMVTWYNHAYYVKHYEAAGYEIEKSYSESRFPFENVKPEFFKKAQELIKRRYQLKALKFTKTSEVMPYVDKMFDLFNASYASLSSFVAINDIQKAYFKKKFISFVNPEYIKFVVDKNDELVGFAIVMPAFTAALKKMNGKLFPFGFRHILNAKKNSKDVIFYLIGIHPDYQNKGVHAVIFNEYYETFKEKGIQTCFRTPELEDNHAIHQIWKHFDPVVYKRRKTYKKLL
ncbi:GNAT family N-acetyltransferase [Algibacter lectus]|uniref:Acetyltransferase (GNAT) family protein n=1 Tax=Algibacter lectus TaxID=221126 RepID=A0A4R8M811_9FLAO|nr:GNAT family N-acetyltransferase [Algibacter lectus]MWW25787.1 GNAT family N-acetyltransferase [Algibacter lectus]TDY61068.1 acetyltransferase (GNAT) family protein [Algibacter lectus]